MGLWENEHSFFHSPFLDIYALKNVCKKTIIYLTHFYAALRMALTRRCMSLRSFIIGSFTQGCAGPPFPQGKRKYLPLWVCMSTWASQAKYLVISEHSGG